MIHRGTKVCNDMMEVCDKQRFVLRIEFGLAFSYTLLSAISRNSIFG